MLTDKFGTPVHPGSQLLTSQGDMVGVMPTSPSIWLRGRAITVQYVGKHAGAQPKIVNMPVVQLIAVPTSELSFTTRQERSAIWRKYNEPAVKATRQALIDRKVNHV